MISYAAVPQILKDLPQWIVWKLEVRKGSSTKIPYDAKKPGVFAKSNDPSTWDSFDHALEIASDPLKDYDGVGFMLQGTDLVGIDFDGVIRDGLAEPYVLEILEKLGNPYCEVTPSGNGLRAFVQCPALPAGQRKFSGNKYGAEIYSGGEGGRYLTVTSNQFSGSGVPKIEDINLAYFLVSQIRNDKLKKLWMGDISEYGDDHSRADLALLDLLSILFNRDAKKVEWAFNASKLGQREKWVERKDYRERTIAKAVSGGPQALPGPAHVSTPNAATLPPAEAIFRPATEIKPKAIKWLWRDRVPLGKITMFAGNPDNGKSLAANSLAAITTMGAAFKDCANTTPPSEVLMLLGEDDLEDTAVPRLMAAGADMKKIHFLEAVIRPGSIDTEVRLDFDLGAIKTKLESHPEIRLIVIDPISNYLGEVSMVAEQEVRSILIPLKRLAAELNIAVVIVMHLNKKSELDSISRVGGAMAFIGVARCSWMFIRDAATEEGEVKDSFSMARIKNNLVKASGSGLQYHITAKPIPTGPGLEPIMAPYVVWGEPINKTADDVLEEKRNKNKPGRPEGTDEALQTAVRWLEHYLGDGPKAQKEIEEFAKNEANISKATLERAKKELKVRSIKVGIKWMWDMPEVNATKETAEDHVTEDSDDLDSEVGGFELR